MNKRDKLHLWNNPVSDIYSYFNLRCRIETSSLRDKIEWWSGYSLEFASRRTSKLQDVIFVLGLHERGVNVFALRSHFSVAFFHRRIVLIA